MLWDVPWLVISPSLPEPTRSWRLHSVDTSGQPRHDVEPWAYSSSCRSNTPPFICFLKSTQLDIIAKDTSDPHHEQKYEDHSMAQTDQSEAGFAAFRTDSGRTFPGPSHREDGRGPVIFPTKANKWFLSALQADNNFQRGARGELENLHAK